MAATSTHCPSCSQTRSDAGLEPQELIHLGTTEKKGINVYWCTSCDGERNEPKT